jgi:hypothetical protein
MVEGAKDKWVDTFNYPTSSAGTPCYQLLPIAAVMDKISPNVEWKREELDCYKNEIEVVPHVLYYENHNYSFNSIIRTGLWHKSVYFEGLEESRIEKFK